MVLFKKIRPRRGSLAVSIICGSPIAASRRSGALAYRIGSPRHDSRYSAIDMSVSLRASKDRTNALNRESLYMISLLTSFCTADSLWHHASGQESASALGMIGPPTNSIANAHTGQQVNHMQAACHI